MFIGAGACGTGGGIKVTTFVVLIAVIAAFIRRRLEPTIFSERIGKHTLIKALSVTVMAVVSIFLGIFCLSLTEKADFLPLVFEVVSAISTVGLSLGLTETLSPHGRFVIMMLMFIGRLCPLATIYLVGTSRSYADRDRQTTIQIG